MMTEGLKAYIAQIPDPTTLEQAIAERNAWIESAMHFSNGETYYRGLLDKIGATLGEEALTADDGSRPGGIVRAKLPALVAALHGQLGGGQHGTV